MTTKNNFLFSLLIMAAALIFSGCDDEEVDVTLPSVSNVTINDMSENIQVNPGSTMHFDAVFSDDVRLGQYKLDIHDNFDGHSHGGRTTNVDAWDTTFVEELIGKTQEVHQDIKVPGNAATGPYHFNLQYFDAQGNEGPLLTLDFEIVDEAEQPVITFISPDTVNELEVAPGGSFDLVVDVADPDGLEEVHVYLVEEHEDHDHDHGRVTSEDPIWEEEFELDGAQEYQVNETIAIPATAEVGHYELKIKAKDLLGNVKVEEIEVHVE
ncbi:MAG: DUF4625 domain-containing protein [Cyclobacteriaceae bacterium]